MKKRIIHFIHEIGDGGASALVKDYSLVMRQDGYEVIVVVTFPDEKASNYRILMNSGVEVIHLYPKRSIFWRIVNKVCPRWFLSRELLKVIKEKEPLAIHAHLPVLQYIAPIRNKINCKVVYTCHSLPEKYLTNGGDETKAAELLIRDNGLNIIALHEAMRKEINSYFKIKNTKVITNGIDLARYRSVKATKTELREKLGIPQEAFVVGHIGRFVDVKNHTFLVDIFHEIKKIEEKGFLLLVGSGPNEPMIRKKLDELKLSNDYIILSHRTDIPELLKAMDAFVLPSKFEGFSLVSIEAQVSGISYTTTTTTTPKDAVVSSNAFILKLTDPPCVWAREIINAKPCSEDKETDFSRYDIHNCVRELEAIYANDKKDTRI